MLEYVKDFFRRSRKQGTRPEEPDDPSIPAKPEMVRRLLDEIENITTSRFYEGPDPGDSLPEVFRMPEGQAGGIPFSELQPSQMYQVFGDCVDWDRYLQDAVQEGVSFRQANQIFQNLLDELPRSQWLEGTGLSEPLSATQSYDDMLREVSERAGPERDVGIDR